MRTSIGRLGGRLTVESPGGRSSREPTGRRTSAPARRNLALFFTAVLATFLARRVWAVAFVAGAVVVFAGASVVFSTIAAPQYRASATMLIQPDPSLVGLTPDLQDDGSDRFDQSQILALQTLVENTLPGQRPRGLAAISITQVGLTDVLQITASARVAADAVASANLLLDDYVSGRRQSLLNHIKVAVAEVDSQLTAVTQALRTSGGLGSAAASKAVITGLTAEYGRLVSLRNQIKLVAATADSTTVLSRASMTDAAVVSSQTRNAILAGLLGALAAIAVLLLGQRLTTARVATHRLSTPHL